MKKPVDTKELDAEALVKAVKRNLANTYKVADYAVALGITIDALKERGAAIVANTEAVARYIDVTVRLRIANAALDEQGPVDMGLHGTRVSPEFQVVERLSKMQSNLAEALGLTPRSMPRQAPAPKQEEAPDRLQGLLEARAGRKGAAPKLAAIPSPARKRA